MTQIEGSNCIIEIFSFGLLACRRRELYQRQGDDTESRCTVGSIEEKQHRFWAKVYFIVEFDLFPGLWQRHSLTFSFSQPIDASSITERASLTANSWLRESYLVDTSLPREAVQVLHHIWQYEKTQCRPN